MQLIKKKTRVFGQKKVAAAIATPAEDADIEHFLVSYIRVRRNPLSVTAAVME